MEVPENLKEKYIERRKQDLAICLSSFELNQLEQIEKVGHQLKGNGATFGHPELSSIGKKIEDSAHDGDLEMLEASLLEFSQWLRHHH